MNRSASHLAGLGLAILLVGGQPGDAAAQACPNDCSGNGLCFVGQCTCSAGFGGADCSLPAGGSGCPDDCSGNGLCTAEGCACDDGFTGDSCSEATLPAADGPLTGTWTVRGGYCKEVDAVDGTTRYLAGKRLARAGLVDLLMSHRDGVADGFFAGLPFVGFVLPDRAHSHVMAGAACTDVAARPAAFLQVLRAKKWHGRYRHRRFSAPWMDVRFTHGDDSSHRSCWLRLKQTDDGDPQVPMCPHGP